MIKKYWPWVIRNALKSGLLSVLVLLSVTALGMAGIHISVFAANTVALMINGWYVWKAIKWLSWNMEFKFGSTEKKLDIFVGVSQLFFLNQLAYLLLVGLVTVIGIL